MSTGTQRGGSELKGQFAYSYWALDAAGQPVVAGTLKLVISDDGHINGSWELTYVGGKNLAPSAQIEQFGPQFGRGALTGHASLNSAHVALNQAVDNTVVLSGSLDEERFAGKWEYETDAGASASGDFSGKIIH